MGTTKRHAQYTPHPTEIMMAAQWHGTRSLHVSTVPRPILSDSCDAIIEITSTSVSGSDLALFNNVLPGQYLHSGDIVGHEAVGIVKEVGKDVKLVKEGDRVVISAVIACGNCRYCKQEQYSLCDCTNPSSDMDELYGHRLAGVFGYTSMTGGFAGLQAEMARVPFADVNLLKIDNDKLSDDQLLLLSDVMCTAWHGCMLGEVSSTDNVVIWGCGPIGLMCGYLAKKLLKANRVICIDNLPYRLRLAQQHGCEVINFDEVDVIKTLQESVKGGADVCIDCVGFRAPKSSAQRLMFHTGLQTDAIDTIKEAIIACKKAGRICLIGDYFGTANDFPVGALMEKSITLRGGQLFAQKYWKHLLNLLNSGEIDGSWLFSHRMMLDEIDKAYSLFNERKDNCTKVILYTKFGESMCRKRGQPLGDIKLSLLQQQQQQQQQSGLSHAGQSLGLGSDVGTGKMGPSGSGTEHLQHQPHSRHHQHQQHPHLQQQAPTHTETTHLTQTTTRQPAPTAVHSTSTTSTTDI